MLKKVLLMVIMLLLIIPVTAFVALADVADTGSSVSSADPLQETDVEKLFQESLDMLAGYWEYGEEYMVYTANKEFVSYDDVEPVVVSAEEYEQVLNKYFNIGSDNLERIRYGDFGAAYNEQDQTYTLEYTGGFGGALPKREYINYVGNPSTGYRVNVYYRDIVYGFLHDVLPAGTNEYEYASEYADPETGAVEYGGFVYQDGPEGYYRVVSYADTGMLYYVWYKGDYIQISGASSVDYVDDFTYMLNGDSEIAITRYVGKDKVVHLLSSYVIDGQEYTVTRISGAFEWVDCVDVLYLPASIKKIDAWSFAYVIGPNVFYEGTQEQWDAIEIGPLNSYFGPHIGYTESVFGEQDCYYCPHCDEYLLEDGTRAPAYVYFYNWDGAFLSKVPVYYKEDKRDLWNNYLVGGCRLPDAEREMDDVYKYSFDGWYNAWFNTPGDTITESIYLTAEYTAQIRRYNVIFQDDDGHIIESKHCTWGSEFVVPTGTWKKSPEPHIYTYVFAGWDKEVVPCAGDVVYVATYNKVYVDYNVRFWLDDQIYSEGTYHWGDTIVLPTDPVKEADHVYTYTFAGWRERTAEECEENWTFRGYTEYYAVFSTEPVLYNAIWKDWDGTVLHQDTFVFGGTPDSSPENPVREPDDLYTYTFWTWNKQNLENGDIVYVAVYESQMRWYQVSFVDWDGASLGVQECYWGDAIIPPVPYRPADDLYTYTFVGWDQEIVPCAGNATYTAVYSREPIAPAEYTVIFKNEDGSIISQTTYLEGETVIVPAAPTKEADNVYSYTFAGWDQEVAATCTGDATYTATYTSTYINYTVVFKNWDGSIIATKTYHWGAKVSAPQKVSRAADETYTYTFAGWDQSVVACAGNAVYTATYTSTYINYTVVFKNWDGKVLSTKKYHYGDSVTAPTDPGKDADNIYTYVFAGWDNQVVSCVGNTTYNAIYTSVYIDYTVVFEDWDGSVISSATYHWGEIISVPKDPVRPNDGTHMYSFDGWSQQIVPCNGNAIYTAVYVSSDSPQVPDSITSHDYVIADGTISKISTGTIVSEFCKKINESEYIKVYNGDQEVPETSAIGTGMVVVIMEGDNVKASVTVVVTADTNGDGKITITDMLAVKAHLLKKSTLSGASAQAADTSGDTAISITDFIQMKAQILGKSNVEPRAVNASAQQFSTASVESEITAAIVTTEYTTTNTASRTVSTLNYSQVVAVIPDKKSLVTV